MRQPKSFREAAAAERISACGRPLRVPIHFFVTAILFFAIGTGAAPWAAAKLADYFYQLTVLAWVHTFTLGWITPALLGLMYYYAPDRCGNVRPSRLAMVQFVAYFLGASGVIAHFMLGSWDGVWMAGVVVALSVLLFAVNAAAWWAPKFGRGAAETGLLIALFFLLCAALLGALLAFDKDRNWLAGTVLRNLSAHAHLAVLGWVTLALCAASYGFLTEAITEKAVIPRSAIIQIFALALTTVGLFVSLVAGTGNMTVWAAATGAVLIGYAISFHRRFGLRELADDPVQRHFAAGLFFLVLAIGGGIYLAISGVGRPFDARMAAAYGVVGLLGWISNFIIAMCYQFCAELVGRVRSAANWPHLSARELSVETGRPMVFYAYNGGVIVMAAGLLVGETAIAQAGACLIAAGGVVFSVATGWTLSFAYRRGAAAASDRLLRAAQD
jgi:hypothetical protein